MPSNVEVLTQLDNLKLHVGNVRTHPLYGVYGESRDPYKKGKADLPDLQGEVDRRMAWVDVPISEWLARRILKGKYGETVLAWDCSAFVFHVANNVSMAQGTGPLADSITVPRAEVYSSIEKWAKEFPLDDTYMLSDRDLDDLKAAGTEVPLTWMCERFNRTPTRLANVRRLISSAASEPVEDFDDIAPGDLFVLKQREPKHLGIVAQRNGNEVQIWDSGASNRTDVDWLGGIGPHDVTINDLYLPIRELAWSTQLVYQFKGFEVRRPKPFVKR